MTITAPGTVHGNMKEPLERFHWVVLPQGMKSSHTISQWFVTQALSPVQQAKPHVLLYHYMEDILIAAEKQDDMKETLAVTREAVKCAGLQIAQDKIQQMLPWQYVG